MSSHKQNIPVITLDGPSGTGKGTLCHKLAEHLGWHFLDSGAIYRVLALAARRQSISFDHLSELVALAKNLHLSFSMDATRETLVFLNHEEISHQIRTEECGQDASRIAVIPEVREALLERQRAFTRLPGLVADGRDMGTVVFPEASLKIYLDASSEERAKRRYFQLQEKGINASLPRVIDELAQRDARDIARSHSPLIPAYDAVHIDTTALTIDQVFDKIVRLVDERLLYTYVN